jgi:hypothetical protein
MCWSAGVLVGPERKIVAVFALGQAREGLVPAGARRTRPACITADPASAPRVNGARLLARLLARLDELAAVSGAGLAGPQGMRVATTGA